MRSNTRKAFVQHPSPAELEQLRANVRQAFDRAFYPGLAAVEAQRPQRTRKPSLATRLAALNKAGMTGELEPTGKISNLKPNDVVAGASAPQNGSGAESNPWEDVPDYGDEAH